MRNQFCHRSGRQARWLGLFHTRALAGTLAAVAVYLTPAAQAQPTDFIQQYQDLPNAGTLFLKFCIIGSSLFCTERRAVAYGQVCDPWLAHDMGTGTSGDVQGGLPPWPMHYAGWRCETTAKVSDLPRGTSGPPEPPARPLLPGEPFYPGDQGGKCAKMLEKKCAVWVSDTGVPLAYCNYHEANGSCPNWTMTPAGVDEGKRRDAALPECPAGLSIGQILAAGLSCKIPSSQIELKPVGGFAN